MNVTADTPLWDASRAMVTARCEELMLCWKRASKTFSQDDIHDLRVASRRLREAIALFTPCFPSKKFSLVKAEAKQLTTLLGTIRNTDEALLFFSALLPSVSDQFTPSLHSYLDTLRSARSREHKRLEHNLKKLNLPLVHYQLETALRRPYLFVSAQNDPFMPIPLFFVGKLGERESAICGILPDALNEPNIAAQHRLRIAIKKFRYTLELAAPLMGERYNEIYARVKGFQELLGALHDLDVFLGLVHEHDFDEGCSTALTELITERRRTMYADFLALHAAHPIDRLGERAREIL